MSKEIHVVDIENEAAKIEEPWHPVVLSSLNGQHVKLGKLDGEFVWHHHEDEDELFMPIDGTLRIQFRGGEKVIRPGQFIVVPRGVEHRPITDEPVTVLLFEPAGTLNTGNLKDHPLTVEV